MNIDEIRKRAVPICMASKRFNKVFGVGANKTGTTTLQAIYALLGLKVAPQHEGELLGVQCYHGRFTDLKAYIDRFDAFQDAPFSVKSTYAQVDALFPGSKFILTHREPEVWFKSFAGYYTRQYSAQPDGVKPTAEMVSNYKYLYPGYHRLFMESNWALAVDDDLCVRPDLDVLFDKQHCIDLYVQRNRAIVRHFSERPDDLLVVDVTKESTTRRIVEFLDLPGSLVTGIPHLNPARGP